MKMATRWRTAASPAALSNLHIVVSEVVSECMRELKSEIIIIGTSTKPTQFPT